MCIYRPCFLTFSSSSVLVIRQFQDYIEPGSDTTASPQRRNPTISETDDDDVLLPLGDNTLTHNLGVPMMVVCTKVNSCKIFFTVFKIFFTVFIS